MRTLDGSADHQGDAVLNLGNDFDRGVLTAAGVNPDTAQLGTIQIDALPDDGDVTIRYTAIATAPASDIRKLICTAADAEG